MEQRAGQAPEEQRILTAAQQRTADLRAAETGISDDALMESAGEGAARWILERLAPRRAAVFAGPGGNGGDALVVARHLRAAGVDVRTVAARTSGEHPSAAGRIAERRLRGGSPPPAPLSNDAAVRRALSGVDCIIDGLFGSGLDRAISGRYEEIVERINASPPRTVSLDLPSGLASDRGATIGPAVRADITLAMAFLKPAHLLFPAAERCGNVAIVPVAYPDAIVEELRPWAWALSRVGVRRRLPTRRPDGHKGTFGRVLVVAGSSGLTGAAILCCRGALRVGAGLVTLATARSLSPIHETAMPETITLPLPERDGCLTPEALPEIERAADRADIVAVGPGLSRHPESLALVERLFERLRGPFVVDADAIVALARRPATLRALGGRSILTPHPGEFAALVDGDAAAIDADRRDAAASLAAAHRVVVVLKGRPTVIAAPDGTVHLNPTGNAGLATGGSGDVLAGMIAGFAAGGAGLEDAARIGAYIHGHAAEIWARTRSERSFLPSDLIDLLPDAVREAERWS